MDGSKILSKTTIPPILEKSTYDSKYVVSEQDCNIIRWYPTGYVTAEENNTMIVTDYSYGNKFAIPSCKVITVVKEDISKLIVDIEYNEQEKYRIVE